MAEEDSIQTVNGQSPELASAEAVPVVGPIPDAPQELSAESIIGSVAETNTEPSTESQASVSELVSPLTDKPEPVSQTESQKIIAEPTVTAPATTIVEKVIYKPTLEMMRTLQQKSLISIQNRKRKKIEKIMTLFTKKQKITTTDIQKVLIVSHNTAVRYADVLEKEGRIKQIGKKGPSVYYTKS